MNMNFVVSDSLALWYSVGKNDESVSSEVLRFLLIGFEAEIFCDFSFIDTGWALFDFAFTPWLGITLGGEE